MGRWKQLYSNFLKHSWDVCSKERAFWPAGHIYISTWALDFSQKRGRYHLNWQVHVWERGGEISTVIQPNRKRFFEEILSQYNQKYEYYLKYFRWWLKLFKIKGGLAQLSTALSLFFLFLCSFSFFLPFFPILFLSFFLSFPFLICFNPRKSSRKSWPFY